MYMILYFLIAWSNSWVKSCWYSEAVKNRVQRWRRYWWGWTTERVLPTTSGETVWSNEWWVGTGKEERKERGRAGERGGGKSGEREKGKGEREEEERDGRRKRKGSGGEERRKDEHTCTFTCRKDIRHVKHLHMYMYMYMYTMCFN